MTSRSNPAVYFRDLDADIALLGGRPMHETVRAVSQAVSHCRALGNLSLSDSELSVITADDIRTPIGKMAHAALLAGIEMAAHKEQHIACCVRAEEKLIDSLSSHAVNSTKYVSPVIVMHGDEPAAIWKGYGEQTAYGLKTVPEIGLVEGMFHAPINGPYPKSQIRTSHALRTASDNDVQFWPMRFGLAALPDNVRRNLQASRSYFNALNTSHQQLQLRAAELAVEALSID